MEIEELIYRALEDVVGEEYISRDPVILDTYNQVWGNKLVFGEKFSTRPSAVLLPGNTEEVQAIVRVCNIHSIPFKPFSSGFEITALGIANEKTIMLDLRRMDRILEIDVKNMHAVVEPYVSVHKLQVEAARYGLYYGAVAAGPSAGVIASAVFNSHGIKMTPQTFMPSWKKPKTQETPWQEDRAKFMQAAGVFGGVQ